MAFARIPKTTHPFVFPEDELETFFRCDDFKYISKDLICNGINDCVDGTDESCSHYEFDDIQSKMDFYEESNKENQRL